MNIKIKNIYKLQGLYIICHLAIILACFYGSLSWWFFSVCFCFVLQLFGVGIGLHRYFAHKSFSTGKYREWFLLFASCITGMGSPISWAGVHRLHHKYADTDKDPHSPHINGIFYILLGAYNKKIKIPASLIKDLLKSSGLIFFHRYYFETLFLWVFLLFLFGGLKAVIFIFCLPVVFIYWATSAGIILNHTLGYRNFETNDKSVNSWILSFYTFGDGWHNNHHRYPDRYSHRHKWWEWDLCAFVIALIFKKQTTINKVSI